jgi:hypothetical protein
MERKNKVSRLGTRLRRSTSQLIYLLRLISESARANSDHVNLNAQVEHYRRLVNSTRYPHLPESDKTQLQARLADLEQRSQAAKKAHDDAIARLTETDTWPVTRRGEPDYKLLVLCIVELRDTITEMHDALNDLVAQRNNTYIAPPPPPPVPSSSAPSMAMDIDRRPLKRRRMSEDDAVDSSVQSSKRTRGSSGDLDLIRNKILALEKRLSDFEITMNQHDKEVEAEIDARMDEKLEALKELRAAPAPSDTKLEPGEDQNLLTEKDKLQAAEQNLTTVGDEIEELAEAVGGLILQSSSHETEIAMLKQDNEHFTTQTVMVSKTQLRRALGFRLICMSLALTETTRVRRGP